MIFDIHKPNRMQTCFVLANLVGAQRLIKKKHNIDSSCLCFLMHANNIESSRFYFKIPRMIKESGICEANAYDFLKTLLELDYVQHIPAIVMNTPHERGKLYRITPIGKQVVNDTLHFYNRAFKKADLW